MKITWKDLTIAFEESSSGSIIEAWTWLIGNDKTPLMITSIGDMFVRDDGNKVYWLNVGEGTFEQVASDIEEFKTKLQDNDQVNEWFMINLVAEIKNSGKELDAGKLYSYIKLPVLGGEYHSDNFELTDLEVHFSFAGQIHEQIRDLPDGTRINAVKIVD